MFYGTTHSMYVPDQYLGHLISKIRELHVWEIIDKEMFLHSVTKTLLSLDDQNFDQTTKFRARKKKSSDFARIKGFTLDFSRLDVTGMRYKHRPHWQGISSYFVYSDIKRYIKFGSRKMWTNLISVLTLRVSISPHLLTALLQQTQVLLARSELWKNEKKNIFRIIKNKWEYQFLWSLPYQR